MDIEKLAPKDGCGIVYGLQDPFDGCIKYVGQTQNPKQRFDMHMSIRRENLEKEKWIQDLKNKCEKPCMVVLEECSVDNLIKREEYWVLRFSTSGKLFNKKQKKKDENWKKTIGVRLNQDMVDAGLTDAGSIRDAALKGVGKKRLSTDEANEVIKSLFEPIAGVPLIIDIQVREPELFERLKIAICNKESPCK